MKRVISITLAVLAAVGLFYASRLGVPAHAQSEKARGPVIHPINPHADGNAADAADSMAEPGPPETDRGKPSQGDAATTGGTATVTPAITYHGGALIQTPTAYVIWYGNWNQANGTDTPAGQQIVRDFLGSVGGSAHYRLNTTYSAGGYNITGNVNRGAETTDTGSQGTRLTDTGVFNVVKNAINSGRLPYDQNGVYFVLSSSNVSESSGFCTRYCGWHTAGNNTSGARIRYSFVGNAARCLSSCAAQTTSPNGNAGVDGMLSVVAHELEEANTDPDLNAWYDSGGAENADKCAWTFGHFQYQTANGAWANMHLGARDYLIQRNLEHNVGGDLCKVDATHN
jgi:hypothetical protein